MLDTLLDQTTTTSYEIMLARAQAKTALAKPAQRIAPVPRDDALSCPATPDTVPDTDARSTAWTPWLLLWTL